MIKGLLTFLYLIPICAFSQFTNSWINFSQNYYRIPVAKDGIYRLSYSDLQTAGFPINSVDPRLIQVYHRGTEQAIYFKHNQNPSDSKFDSGEYFEFYGQKNDGKLDSKLYQPASAQPHSYYNLYSDTTAYFLTWNLLPVQGKRITDFSEVNVNNTLAKEVSQNNERLLVFSQDYSGGETEGDLIQYSYFNKGEGWTGPVICTVNGGCTGQQDFIIDNVSGGVTSAGNPQLEIQLAGRDDIGHAAEIYAGANSGSLRLVTTVNFTDFETSTTSAALNWSDIGGDGKITVRVKALGIGGVRDRLSVSFIKITFPQNFDLAGQTEKRIQLNANPVDKSYIELLNAPSGGRVWDVTDVNNVFSIGTIVNGIVTSAVVPTTNIARSLFISNQFITPGIKKVSFRQINPATSNFLIVTHRSLRGPALGYSDVIKAYASYRASAEGGSYDTLTVNIDQLYNQFNYGETSSLGMYEFMRYMYAGGKLKYLFIIGKGREVNSGFHRKTNLSIGEFKDLVPVAGYPASDLAYTAGLSGVAHLPSVATGRITASTPAQVAAYLNKVKETEASTYNDSWHKQMLHLSGGIQPAELQAFRSFMGDFASKAEGEFYGASVKTFGKHEASPIELINISKEINAGVNMVTFFGHSAPNQTDIDIGYVTDPAQGYNNPGKYPSILVNGCNAGEFFNNTTNFAEDWILAANKGARSFIANSSYGFVYNLKYYTDLFYESAFTTEEGIRSGIGNVQLKVAEKYLNSAVYITTIAVIHQMVLLGDPSLKIFGAEKPDFEIKDAGLSAIGFDAKPVTASADSFKLKMIIKNFGLVTKEKLPIRVVQKFPDNTTITHESFFTQPLVQDTLTFVIKRENNRSFTNNVFVVSIDQSNVIAELNEGNNSASLTLSIPGTKNLYPDDFSIAAKEDIDLIFLNTDLLTLSKQYLVELDTVKTFNSTVLKKFTVTGTSLLKQPIKLLSKDSTVYYWRTRLLQSAEDEWQTTSFSFIKNGNEGWAQIRLSQFDDNSLTGLVKDPVIKKLKFAESTTSILVKTFGKDNPAPPSEALFTIDGVDYWKSIQGFNCRDNSLNMVAFTKNTVVPYEGIPFTYQNAFGRACGREPQIINSFLSNETETGNNDDLIKYVNNINAGDSVVLFTMGDAGINLYSTNVKNKLGELGINIAQLNAIIPGEPVVIFGRKGAPAGTAKIRRSTLTPETAQELLITETLTGKISSGSMQSTLIGPAMSWKQFTSRVSERSVNDQVQFDLYGVKQDGSQVLVQPNIGNTFDLSSISATLYPQMKLIYFTKDDTDLTAVQLKKWFVFFDPVAEGMIVYKGATTQQTFQEGLSWTGKYSFVNLSSKIFSDSLKVEVEYLNKKNQQTDKVSFKIKPPAVGDSSHFQITKFPKAGLNDVNVFVNRRYQPELYYENNTLNFVDYLNVLADNINPVLDVSIDGRYIANGDYISPTPAIVFTLRDENPYLFKKDTLGVDLFLKYPCATASCSFKRIKLKGSDVKWFPATATSNFRIEFNPTTLLDGEYTLRAQIKDATGNSAGEEPYEITFNVSSEAKILVTPAYPNPSSSDFVFKFLLTGQSALDKFSLHIWSQDGRLINSFKEDDLGTYYVGTHQFQWNGKDESGNIVQPGIYFYKLEVGSNGTTETSHGKLVLIR
jgi:hypothetical protein